MLIPELAVVCSLLVVFGTVADFVTRVFGQLWVGILAAALAKFGHAGEQVGKAGLGGGRQLGLGLGGGRRGVDHEVRGGLGVGGRGVHSRHGPGAGDGGSTRELSL